MQIHPVAAWRGTQSAPYEYELENQPINFNVVDGIKSTGDCKIKVNALFIVPYTAGTWSAALVGFDYEMPVSHTAVWRISSQWTLDYYLHSYDPLIDGSITISVVYRVYDGQGVLRQEKVAWSHTVSGSDSYEETITKAIYQSFTYDLEQGKTYLFYVGLKVYIGVSSPYYQVRAHSNHNNPAVLNVDHITVYNPYSP